MTKFMRSILAAVYALMVGGAQAGLADRGGGLIYDDVLNITWLADANYAYSSGFSTDANGRMNFADANQWASQLTYGGYTDWRLPTVGPVNGSAFNYNFQAAAIYDGMSEYGFNIGALGTTYAGRTGSELAYMFYTNLGGTAPYDTDGNTVPGFSVGAYGLPNSGPFVNLQKTVYWSGTTILESPGFGTDYAWGFTMDYGRQDAYLKSAPASNYSWAVRDGDVVQVNVVPEPGTLVLLALGLAGLGFSRRDGGFL